MCYRFHYRGLRAARGLGPPSSPLPLTSVCNGCSVLSYAAVGRVPGLEPRLPTWKAIASPTSNLVTVKGIEPSLSWLKARSPSSRRHCLGVPGWNRTTDWPVTAARFTTNRYGHLVPRGGFEPPLQPSEDCCLPLTPRIASGYFLLIPVQVAPCHHISCQSNRVAQFPQVERQSSQEKTPT